MWHPIQFEMYCLPIDIQSALFQPRVGYPFSDVESLNFDSVLTRSAFPNKPFASSPLADQALTPLEIVPNLIHNGLLRDLTGSRGLLSHSQLAH